VVRSSDNAFLLSLDLPEAVDPSARLYNSCKEFRDMSAAKQGVNNILTVMERARSPPNLFKRDFLVQFKQSLAHFFVCRFQLLTQWISSRDDTPAITQVRRDGIQLISHYMLM